LSNIYIEQRIGDVAIGYRYYPDQLQYEMIEQVGENRAVTCVEAEDVPENVKKAVKILLEEGN
jgi:hypothetical protein